MAPNRVLFLCVSEYGALNSFLAVCHELLQLSPATEVHLASFEAAAKPTVGAFQYALESAPTAARPTFHALPGPALTETLLAEDPDFYTMMGPPLSVWTVGTILPRVIRFMMPWEARDFVKIYRAIEELIQTLEPSLVVVDNVLCPGLSVCRTLGQKHMILCPNTLKEFIAMFQPQAQGLWKYSAPSSDLGVPVPWHKIPLNIFFVFALVYYSIRNPRASRILKEIQSKIDKIQFCNAETLSYNRPEGLKVLVASRPETDFHFPSIPSDVVTCGPIVRPAARLSGVDAELEQWLSKGPTVLINLGSLVKNTEEEAVEMAMAVRILLEESSKGKNSSSLQVLWKLKLAGDASFDEKSPIYDILKTEIESGRIRVTSWIEADPVSILASGHIICSVHHGGANTYNEAVTFGVPHVVLPVWADTYDFAHRVETLGVGRWGSRQARPSFKASELGPILLDVVLGPRAQEYQENARRIARVCGENGGAAAIAAREILASIP
ncbi:UDP-Glycosyltransferase/glycogen phosphorylase [Thozetella sp. PMI_491]|nr:UDP-Glycosyltransferase/glycogen phosphorylase [Thozetella sp. PMI_491]